MKGLGYLAKLANEIDSELDVISPAARPSSNPSLAYCSTAGCVGTGTMATPLWWPGMLFPNSRAHGFTVDTRSIQGIPFWFATVGNSMMIQLNSTKTVTAVCGRSVTYFLVHWQRHAPVMCEP